MYLYLGCLLSFYRIFKHLKKFIFNIYYYITDQVLFNR
nr:MAG TPA: hypothetical protein [Bacteriophage sp.]